MNSLFFKETNIVYEFIFLTDDVETVRIIRRSYYPYYYVYVDYNIKEITIEKLNSQYIYLDNNKPFFTEGAKKYLLKLIKNRAFI